MKSIFLGSELVELGIQIEKNGRDFYHTLSRQSKNEEAKKIFEFLAKEEEKHVSVFQKILNSAHSYQSRGYYPDEYFAYMNTLAGGYIFTQADKGKEIARKIKSDKEALSMGIQFEKDSILFYEGMKKVMAEKDYPVIEKLIMQEHKHLMQLSGFKKT